MNFQRCNNENNWWNININIGMCGICGGHYEH